MSDFFEDAVDHPEHYTAGDIECIDAIQASMSVEEFRGYLKGNTMKYIWRYRKKKHPLEDILKARWYLDKLAELLEAEEGDGDWSVYNFGSVEEAKNKQREILTDILRPVGRNSE